MRQQRWMVVASFLFMVALAACQPTPAEIAEDTATPESSSTEEGDTGDADQGKPGVVIDAPPSGSSYAQGETVFVQSTATDTVGVVRVDLQVDGSVVRSDSTPDNNPQTQFGLLQGWDASAPGDHTLTVVTYRADGTASDPASISVTVTEEMASGGDETEPCTATPSTVLNVRGGPDTAYDVMGRLELGQMANVTGMNGDGSWWQIDFGGASGWVYSPYVYTNGNCSAVGVAQAPPAPTSSGGGNNSGGGGSSPTATYTPTTAPTQSATDTNQATPTATATATATTETNPTAAPDNDTRNNPSAYAAFRQTGDHQLTYSNAISAPDGDPEDWIGFKSAPTEGDTASIWITLSCTGDSESVNVLRAVVYDENGNQITGTTTFCGDTGERYTVESNREFTVRIYFNGSGTYYAEYSITVEGIR